jgi:N-[(2S)-2-amino-2-carboxyethyl]-L-glutamate dehydrogenase
MITYLSRSDIVALGGDRPELYVEAVRSALALHAAGEFVQPLKPYLRRGAGNGHIADRIIAMPVYLEGPEPVAGLKWVGSKHDNPESRGLERASALIVLNDPETHYPVAVLEGGLISGMRTAAVTAVAAGHLARRGFHRLACLGCGPIGRMQVAAMVATFPSIEEVVLFDLRTEAARELAATVVGPARRIAGSGEAAVRAGDVVIAATVAAEPYVPAEWISEGTFISNVSLMDFHPDVYLAADKIVVDDWDQANREGKVIHRLVQEGRFSRDRLHAELGEIVTGRRPGRESPHERILLNPMGMAITDIACAREIYRRALAESAGTRLPLA